jgi:23S rRNA (pseudouridine1915-N3)-methyltransferase
VNVRIVAVGKIKERGIREALDDYYGRIAHYARFDEVEIKDGDPAEIERRFEKAIPEGARVIALEVEGKALDSHGLARLVGNAEDTAVRHLVFMIGGSYGLPPAVRARATSELSLSRMTLPHRLARLFLAEQVYRAFTILRGEPYSH